MFLDKLNSTVASLMSNAVGVSHRVPEMDPTKDPAFTTVLLKLAPGRNDVLHIVLGCQTCQEIKKPFNYIFALKKHNFKVNFCGIFDLDSLSCQLLMPTKIK